MRLLLIYPHQLFPLETLPRWTQHIWLVEEPLFFHDPIHAPAFHRQKLILHRASMRHYAEHLIAAGYKVQYWEYDRLSQNGAAGAAAVLMAHAAREGAKDIYTYEPVDYLLERRLRRAAQQEGLSLTFLDTPAFLTTRAQNAAFLSQYKRYHQTSYYIWQRKRLHILLTDAGEPVGGRWTYDVDNRKRLPPKHRAPTISFPAADAYVQEATEYVRKKFPQAWGAEGPWWLPITHEAAAQWLDNFLQERLALFGPYEDAFEPEEPFLYHSVLSPLLNIGLLTPAQVVQRTLQYAQTHEVPIASLEGFIRQVIGWREYIRMVYDTAGTLLRKSNHWQHERDFPSGWEEAQTGCLPVDTTLRRLYRWGYTHHIERLMVLGSFLFLNEVHPHKVYQFFMRSYVDAYDWVMVPNVYGMSQHASPLITTKPYFCGSRYLLSMSHYPRGEWAERWDQLFWDWVARHREALSRYPRLLPLLRSPKLRSLPGNQTQNAP